VICTLEGLASDRQSWRWYPLRKGGKLPRDFGSPEGAQEEVDPQKGSYRAAETTDLAADNALSV